MNRLIETIDNKHQLVMASVSSRSDLSWIPKAGADAVFLNHTTELGISRVGSLLPVGNANDIVLEMCRRIPVRDIDLPVFAAVCGSEPVRYYPLMLDNLREEGIEGIVNYPSIGLIDGTFRHNLESVSLGARNEEKMMNIAHNTGLQIFPLVYSLYEALAMARLGAEILVLDLGFRSWDYDIQTEMTQYRDRIRSISKGVRENWPGVRILVYSMYREIEIRLEKMMTEIPTIDGILKNIII